MTSAPRSALSFPTGHWSDNVDGSRMSTQELNRYSLVRKLAWTLDAGSTGRELIGSHARCDRTREDG